MNQPSGQPLLDFATLRRPRRPNNWLVANRHVTSTTANALPPRFAVPPEKLAAMWRTLVEEVPRTTITAVSPDGLQIEAIERSAVFRFVDDISAVCFPDGAGGSAIAVYSRSRVGYWDLGANRRRIKRWLRRLVLWVREST